MKLIALLAASWITMSASAQDIVIVVETCDHLSAPPPTQLEAPIIEVPEAPVPTLQAPQQYAAQPYAQPYAQAADPTNDARLLELRRSRPGIGGPIAMMAAGFIAGIASAWSAALANSLDDWGCSFDCGPSEEVIGLSVMSAAAFSVAVAGVITLFRRVAKRRRINREIRALQLSY